MAQVRITQTLLSEINTKVDQMAAAEHTANEKALTDSLEYKSARTAAHELGHKAAWGVYYDTAVHRDMPDEWKITPRHGLIVKVMSVDDVEVRRIVVANNILLPPGSDAWNCYVEVPISSFSEPVQQLLQTWRARQLEISSKYAQVSSQINAVLGAFGSLNAAVKHEPAILLYVPQSYRDKLEEKATRGKRDTSDLPTVDSDLLNTVGVTHALGG